MILSVIRKVHKFYSRRNILQVYHLVDPKLRRGKVIKSKKTAPPALVCSRRMKLPNYRLTSVKTIKAPVNCAARELNSQFVKRAL